MTGGFRVPFPMNVIYGMLGLVSITREYHKVGIYIKENGLDTKAPKHIEFDDVRKWKKIMENYLWN